MTRPWSKSRRSRNNNRKDTGDRKSDYSRSRSRYQGSSHGRDRYRSESLKCKQCDKHNKRIRHYGISEDKCFLNPKHKGLCPEWACRILEVDYVKQKHFEDKE